MGLKKGQTNNQNGRPKGTPNKATQTAREWVQMLIDNNREQLERDLQLLESKERWQVIERLMQYVVPKQQAVTAQIDFNRLSDEQLDTIINELTNSLNDEDTN